MHRDDGYHSSMALRYLPKGWQREAQQATLCEILAAVVDCWQACSTSDQQVGRHPMSTSIMLHRRRLARMAADLFGVAGAAAA